MHKKTKKVENTTLYRLFFEICSVTPFQKSRLFSDKPLVTPLNSIPDPNPSGPKPCYPPPPKNWIVKTLSRRLVGKLRLQVSLPHFFETYVWYNVFFNFAIVEKL